MDEVKWSKNNVSDTNINFPHTSVSSSEKLSHEIVLNNNLNNVNFSNKPQQSTTFDSKNIKLQNESKERIDNSVLDSKLKIQQIVESTISESSREKISQIVELVSALSSPEKLLLYMRLPTDTVTTDPLRQPLNPLGSRTEISQTINWIRTHLEEDPELSLPKQDVYEEYTNYCHASNMKALSTADFGKVMKQVYPRVRPRRLGTRGNSRYCYAGLRKRIKLEPPQLPDFNDNPKSTEPPCSQADLTAAASCLIREWAKNLLGIQFPTLCSLACHLLETLSVDTQSIAALTLLNAFGRGSDKGSISPTGGICLNNNKHRETQLQLQRKIQQREVIREQKRKLQLQSSKCEMKHNRNKKPKLEQFTPCPSPTFGGDEEMGCFATSSCSSPQAQGMEPACQNSVCDNNNKVAVTSTTKPLTSLPDFSSFQQATGSAQNFDVVHDFSTKKNTVNCEGPKKPKQISVRAFATKSISRSNSYESNKNSKFSTPNTPTQEFRFDSALENVELSHSSEVNEHKEVNLMNEQNLSTVERNSMVENKVKSLVADHSVIMNECNGKSKVLDQSLLAADFNCKQMDVKTNKVAIPRLPSRGKSSNVTSPSSIIIFSNSTPVVPQRQKNKYKTIQPKLNRDTQIRSQENTVESNEVNKDSILKLALPQQVLQTDVQQNEFNKLLPDKLITTPKMNQLLVNLPHDIDPVNKISMNTNNFLQNSEVDKTYLASLDNQKINSEKHRERGISLGNIDKDALDDYLYGGSNSQEHEEEIMQYFQNNSSASIDELAVPQDTVNVAKMEAVENKTIDEQNEKSDKISQLRQLLQKNLKPEQKEPVKSTRTENKNIDPNDSILKKTMQNSALSNYLMRQHSYSNLKPSAILPSLLTSTSGLNARRRVSFETPVYDNVPASPNTRRKNFSFTPISPGPQSPGGGQQSKCSSTNASPFVSPRNTPVPRNRTNNCPSLTNTRLSSTVIASGKNNKVAHDFIADNHISTQNEVTAGHFAIPIENQLLRKHSLPMSAPPSPMLPLRTKSTTQSNYLQTLLDNDSMSLCSYVPNYQTNINEYIDKRLKIDTKRKVESSEPRNRLEKLKIDIRNASQQISPDSPNIYRDMAEASPFDTKISPSTHSSDPLSQEVSRFFPDDTASNVTTTDSLSYRSQSVPLHQMKNLSSPLLQNQFYNQQFNFNIAAVPSANSSVGQTPIPNEFSDFGNSFGENNLLNNENLDKIFNILDTNNAENNSFVNNTVTELSSTDIETPLITNTNQSYMSEFPVMKSENTIKTTRFNSEANFQRNQIILNQNSDLMIANQNFTSKNNSILNRSQSIDLSEVEMETFKLSNQPSRSVPNTPLPISYNDRGIDFTEFSQDNVSRSYPTTPLNSESKPIQMSSTNDYLLNGQPVVNKVINNGLSFIQENKRIDESLSFVDEKTENIVAENYDYPFNTPILLDNETYQFNREANEQESIGFNEPLLNSAPDDFIQLQSDNTDNFTTNINISDQTFLLKSESDEFNVDSVEIK